ncbi:MAG TPA: hypothetical protein VF950_07050, partial [Planctomycetota bacterium]
MTTATLPSRWVKPTARGLRIVIPATFDPFIRTLLASWLVFWAVAEISVALGWLGVIEARIPPAPVWIAFLAAFTAAGAFLAWHFAWVISGREIITSRDGVLSIARGIGRWTGRPRNFPWKDVSDLRMGSYGRRVIYPQWGRLFVGKDDAYLSFTHGGHTHAFARGLKQEEALDLLHLLEARG